MGRSATTGPFSIGARHGPRPLEPFVTAGSLATIRRLRKCDPLRRKTMAEAKKSGLKEKKASYNLLTDQRSSWPGAAAPGLCAFHLYTPCCMLVDLKSALNLQVAPNDHSYPYSLCLILSGGSSFSTGAYKSFYSQS